MAIRSEEFYRRMMLLVLGIVAIIIFCTFRDYGVTWDEELQSQYGQAIVDYYLSLFRDQRYVEIYNLYLYGGMFDGLASVFDRFAPITIEGARLSVYDIRHFLNALFGLAGLWGTWRLGRFFGGGAVGLAALLITVLTPSYYGHMFNNPKDIPFAAGIVWTMYYMAKSLQDWPLIRRGTIAKLGIILGLTLGIRVGGAMALIFWALIAGWHAMSRSLSRLEAISSFWRIGWQLFLPVGILSYIVMLACWPWAQQSPILNPLAALNEFKNFPHNVEVLLDGTIYMSTKLPWYYVPLYFGVQLPEFMLALLAANVILLPRIWRGLIADQKSALVLILTMALAPMLYAIAAHPSLYDAVRHFLFAVPLLSIPAALAAREIGRAFCAFLTSCKTPFTRSLIAAEADFAVAFYFSLHIALMTLLHPYEYIYVNVFAGGVPGAFGHYELDYWGSSFKEAAEQIQVYVAKEGGVPPGKIYRIAICGPWDSAMIYLPPDYEPVVANEPAEFFLSTTRWMCQNMRPGREVLRITRLGVPLAVVKDLRIKPPR